MSIKLNRIEFTWNGTYIDNAGNKQNGEHQFLAIRTGNDIRVKWKIPTDIKEDNWWGKLFDWEKFNEEQNKKLRKQILKLMLTP